MAIICNLDCPPIWTITETNVLQSIIESSESEGALKVIQPLNKCYGDKTFTCKRMKLDPLPHTILNF